MNWNLEKSVRYARELGIDVTTKNRTGELVFSHPSVDRTVRANARRKDTPRAVVTFIRKVETGAGKP